MTPDWQLPPGVDRGLHDYLRSGEMVAGYDAAVRESALAAADVAFCEAAFPAPGRLADLGCGTGRLATHFADKGFDCVGVDLSDAMLIRAAANAAAAGATVTWHRANLVDLGGLADASFDYAVCLFSTLGMVRGAANRAAAVASAARILKPGGRFVLHAHNRLFRGLGARTVATQGIATALGRASAGDVTRPQAYAGAPLTLHLFTRRGAVALLAANGFRVLGVSAVSVDGVVRPARRRDALAAYGYLLVAERV
jgi:SAM-dependent methyltransferase